MSYVKRAFTLSDLCDRFDVLIENFRKLKHRTGKGAPIESTKLWVYRKQLNNIKHLDSIAAARLVGVVNKYCAVNVLFQKSSGITLPDEKLLALLSGKPVVEDADEHYNHTFFELSMAIRFAERLGAGAKIDLSSNCDVVVLDDELAIECKYLHSARKIRGEFSDAMSQLDERLQSKQAKLGAVAFDLSDLVDKEKIQKFAAETFESFARAYEKLINSRSVFASDIGVEGVLKSVINDGNFARIVQSFIAHEAEVVFFSNFTKGEVKKLTTEKVAVLFQQNNYLCFVYEDELTPVPARSLGYYINGALPISTYDGVTALIKSLCVGN